MRTIVASLALLLWTSCAHSPLTPSDGVNARLVLAPGQRVSVEGTSLDVRFDRVTGDSRCPADAFCVLGGDAVVEISVLESAGIAQYDLHTGDLRPVHHRDLTIALEQLQPYPFSAQPIDPRDYRATLRVTD